VRLQKHRAHVDFVSLGAIQITTKKLNALYQKI